jgi:hypothetical protein
MAARLKWIWNLFSGIGASVTKIFHVLNVRTGRFFGVPIRAMPVKAVLGSVDT